MAWDICSFASANSFGPFAFCIPALAWVTSFRVSFSCFEYPFTVFTRFGIRSALLWTTFCTCAYDSSSCSFCFTSPLYDGIRNMANTAIIAIIAITIPDTPFLFYLISFSPPKFSFCFNYTHLRGLLFCFQGIFLYLWFFGLKIL